MFIQLLAETTIIILIVIIIKVFFLCSERHLSSVTCPLRSWVRRDTTTTTWTTWRRSPNATNTVSQALWRLSVAHTHAHTRWTSVSFDSLCVSFSDAVRQREVLLLQVPHQRAAVDLAADPLLHHVPPVELQTRVHRLHAHGGQVRGGLKQVAFVGRSCRGQECKTHCNYDGNT